MKNKNLKGILPHIPDHTYSFTGRPCEPVSLLVIGHRRHIQNELMKHGWRMAVGINPISALRAFFATVFNASYPSGPVSPLFIHKKPQQLAFQKPTRSNTFRRRHHLRLWKTRHSLNGNRVWVGMISYDRAVGFYKRSLFPTHHISSNIDSEENFLARTLGIYHPEFVAVTEPEIGTISNGDPYTWDGKALVLDLSK